MDILLKEIIDQVAKELDLEVLPDHVHMLCEVDPPFGVHRFVKQFKDHSSRLLCQRFPRSKSTLPTLWSHSYFVSTLGGPHMGILKQHIETQKTV